MVITRGARGAYGARGAWSALRALGATGAGVLGTLCVGCAFIPAAQERELARQTLQGVPDVTMVTVGCGGSFLASDGACADVVMKDGARFKFERVGSKSFGSTALNVVVAKAGRLEPRIASCSGVGPPNFHRGGPLGHHFHPTLIDLKEAVTRYRDVLEEVEFWPHCPQFYDVQSRQGQVYRYCARVEGATPDPPRPDSCK